MPASSRLTGFHIRPPAVSERAAVAAWFASTVLQHPEVVYLAAFGQPGDIPLGAVAARRSPDGSLIQFLIHVLPHARRRKIGSTLIQHLATLAARQSARRLVCVDLIHQDSPENAFYQSAGLTPERRFATYVLTDYEANVRFADRVLAHAAKHQHLSGTVIVGVDANEIPPESVAALFARHYGLDAARHLRGLRDGYFDRDLSRLALHDGQCVAGIMLRTRSDEPLAKVDLILVDPAYRRGPIAIALCASLIRAVTARKIPGVVFEADPAHDIFAAHFARTVNAQPGDERYRYALTLGASGQPAMRPAIA